MAQTSGTEPRIAMRVAPDQKALIERGARARGLSVTDFMLTLALREAEIALSERVLFSLDEDAYNKFVETFNRQEQIKPELERLLNTNRNSKWRKQV